LQVKTVSSFRASGTGIVSPLPYAVVDSATLRNLKEAPAIRMVDPFTGADLCKHRVAEHRGGGSDTLFNCASSSAVISPNRKSPDFTARLHLLNFSAFYLRQVSDQCCTTLETLR